MLGVNHIHLRYDSQLTDIFSHIDDNDELILFYLYFILNPKLAIFFVFRSRVYHLRPFCDTERIFVINFYFANKSIIVRSRTRCASHAFDSHRRRSAFLPPLLLAPSPSCCAHASVPISIAILCFLFADPVVKEQCRMIANVNPSPTPLAGAMSVVGVGE